MVQTREQIANRIVEQVFRAIDAREACLAEVAYVPEARWGQFGTTIGQVIQQLEGWKPDREDLKCRLAQRINHSGSNDPEAQFATALDVFESMVRDEAERRLTICGVPPAMVRDALRQIELCDPRTDSSFRFRA